jgi:hypothetical protein
MASSYSSDLKLELMVTGENAGTWGDKTNTNLNLVQQAIAGFEQVTLSSGATTALVMSDGALSNARNLVIKFATITAGASTVCTIPDSIEKFYIFDVTGVTNPSNLTIKTASGTGFSPDAQKIYAAYSDGTNLNEVSLDTLGGTIGTAQVADSAISTAKIADDAVTSAKIADDAVVAAAIADDAVVAAAIADGAVGTAAIADDAVSADKLADTSVSAGSYTSASITVDAQGRLTAASSGSAAGGALAFRIFANGPASGNRVANPASNAFAAYAYSGGGGGGGGAGSYNKSGGNGGSGSFAYYAGNLTGGTTYAYNVGGGGSAGASPSHGGTAGNPGGATSVANLFTVNGGNGGNGGPSGSNGNSGSNGSAPGATTNYPKNFFFETSNYSNAGAGGKRDAPNQPTAGNGGVLIYYENDLT